MPEHMRVMCSLTPAERQCLAYSHNGIAHVAFDHMHSLRFRDVTISWLNPTPHATAVYASCSASLPPHATLASRRPATTLPGPDLHRLIAPALAGAFSFDHLVGKRTHQRWNFAGVTPQLADLFCDVKPIAHE